MGRGSGAVAPAAGAPGVAPCVPVVPVPVAGVVAAAPGIAPVALGFERASGWVSKAEPPETVVAVTSPLKPVAPAGVGTLAGTEGRTFSMAGDPVLDAARTSGPRRMKSRLRPTMLPLSRCSWLYFIRARAAGSASGTGISISCSRFLASSTRGLSGYDLTMRAKASPLLWRKRVPILLYESPSSYRASSARLYNGY